MAGLIVARARAVKKKDQIQTLYRALEYVKDFSVAVDGGANIGDWLAVMIERFSCVHAFEPNIRLIDSLRTRFPQSPVFLYHAALWSHASTVELKADPRAPTKDRSRYCVEGGDIHALTIDSLSLSSCGLIKLDLEGAEILALHGSMQTLKEFHPVVIVECRTSVSASFHQEKPGKMLKPLGYFEAFRNGPDRVYTWET